MSSTSSPDARREVAWLVGLTFAVCTVFYVLAARADDLGAFGGLLVIGLLYIQGFFDRATIDTGPTAYWTGEFGAGLAAAE